MLPTGSDLRALRAKLLERLGNVKQFFEATNVGFGLNSSPYWSAFDALRRNKPLAEEFVGQLQALLDFLDSELAPALLAAQNATGAAQNPVTGWPNSAGPLPAATSGAGSGTAASIGNLHGDETRILDNLHPPIVVPKAPPSGPPVRAPIATPPTPGIIQRRPEPTKAEEPPHKPPPAQQAPKAAEATPVSSHKARPSADFAGELSLADVLIADRDLLAEPPAPVVPVPVRRPAEGLLPGMTAMPPKATPSSAIESQAPAAVPSVAAQETGRGIKLPPIARVSGAAASSADTANRAAAKVAKSLETGQAHTKPAETAKPEPKPTPVVKPEPKPTPVVKPEPKPTPVAKPEPKPAPVAKPEPKPTPVVKPEPKPAEAIKTQAKPADTSKAQAKPAETVKAQPKLAETVKPEPKLTETVKPEAKSGAAAKPEPKPAVVVKPQPKPVEAAQAKPAENKPVPVAKAAENKPVSVAKTAPATVASQASVPATSKPALASKPTAVKVAAAKLAAVKATVEKAPVLDQSDLSDPAMSPSQFFRVFDAKLDDKNEK